MTTFDVNVPAGAYNVVATSNNNIFISSTAVNVNLPATKSIADGDYSFNGGSITITADNLSPASYITVNNKRGKLLSRTASAATYQVPSLVTTLTQTTFNLVPSVSPLDMKAFSYFSDTSANEAKSFDNEEKTFYTSNNA